MSTGFGYPLEFYGVFGFMVLAEFLHFPVDACHRARVSCVSAVDEFGSDEYDVGSAAGV